jgi:hypothetical protein
MKLFDYINAINSTKKPLLDTEDEQVGKGYVPFFVNKTLSYFPDTILQSNEINQRAHLDKKMQFDYLLHSIRPRKRYSKWLKKNTPASLEIIKKHYGYSNKKAIEALQLLTKEQLNELESRYGGQK